MASLRAKCLPGAALKWSTAAEGSRGSVLFRRFQHDAASPQSSESGGSAARNGAHGAHGIFVKNVSQKSSCAPVLLGMMNFFKRHVPTIGFFNPVKCPPLISDGLSRHVHLMKHACGLPDDPKKMIALEEDDAFQMLASGQHADFLDKVFSAYNDYKETHDMVVVNGWRAGGTVLNAQMAAHLSLPALLIVDYDARRSNTFIYDRAMSEVQEYMSQRAKVIGILVNKVPPSAHERVRDEMRDMFAGSGIPYLGALPLSATLAGIYLDQVVEAVDGRLLFSQPAQVNLDTRVQETFVGTSQCGAMLKAMRNMQRPLVVTTSDRVDTITACVALHLSGAKPIAGLLLADHDGTPSPYREDVHEILNGLERHAAHGQPQLTYRLPIFMTSLNVYNTVQKIGNIKSRILATSNLKIDVAKQLFDDNVDTDAMMAGLASIEEKLTPSKFLHSIRQRCRRSPQRIVLPEASDHRVLTAASLAAQKGLARITLLGHKETVLAEAMKVGVDLTGVEVVDTNDEALRNVLAKDLVAARKKKGMTAAQALELLEDVNYFGTMMVRTGLMDGLVSGATHTTAATIRPGMQVLKNPDMPLVSSVFFMCLPSDVLVYGDCAVNVDPTPEQLALIAIASAETAAAFGLEPRVAMLSYSTLGSGSGPQVDEVTEATRIARERRPDLKIDGPMQYDAATNPRIAAVKVKDNAMGVAGRANVLIFPDLNSGNSAYKAVQQSSGAIAMGPIMQGLAMPVNDLSRGCTVADILDTICATSLQAQFKKALREATPNQKNGG